MAQKFKNQIDAQEGIKITNELYDGSNAAGNSGQVLSSTGSATQWIDFEADVAKRIDVTVKNVSGASLAKGVVVHAAPTATPPSGNVIEVIAADANVASSMPGIGVLNETIADEAEGEAVMFGTVQGIDTSGFSIGDELYVSTTAGELTATKPTANDELVQKVAIVIKSHASNGLIKVFGAGRANDVPNQIDRNVNFTDNSKLTFGDSTTPDLEIYHDGSNSYINDTGTGNLLIRAGNLQLQRADGTQAYLAANTGAELALYYAGSKKFETTNTGVSVTGNATLSSTAPILYLANTTSSTGKTWRFSSAANGNAYITQDGVIDAITLSHTSGNATFAGTITASGYNDSNWNTAYTYSQVGHLPLAGGTMTGDITISSTSPELKFVDTNSFTDANDRWIVRGGADTLIMRWYDNSASSNTDVLTLSSTAATFAGDVSIPVAKSLYFGGGSHTYIKEDIDDRLRFFVGGVEFMRFTEDTSDTINFYKDSTFGGSINVQKSIYQTATGGFYINKPYGADFYTTTNDYTGAIEIALPTGGNGHDDMIKFVVDIFDYRTQESVTVFVGGYTYQNVGSGNTTWYYVSATVLGQSANQNYTVRFGDNGTEHCVWIGDTDSTWNHLQVIVRDFFAGYTADINNYLGAWDINVVTTQTTVNNTLTNCFPMSSDTITGYLPLTGGTVSGNVLLGSNNNISMDASASGQLMVNGVGYQGAIALDGNAMHIYHNSSSRSLILGTNETARLTIDGGGASTFSGSLTSASLSAASIGISGSNGTDGKGISLYGGAHSGQPTYGIMFMGTGTYGTMGYVTGSWATYFTMDSGSNRGWIFRDVNNGNKASINNQGHATFGTPSKFYTNDSELIIQDAGTNAVQIKTGAGDELYIGGNNSYQFQGTTTGQARLNSVGYVRVTAGASNYTGIEFFQTDGSRVGYLYGDSGQTSNPGIGILDSDGNWAVRCRRDISVDLRVNDVQKFNVTTAINYNYQPTWIEGGSADWNETTPGTTTGSLHLVPSTTDNFGSAITFGASDNGSGANAQAGIYTRTDGAYGTKMYFATSGSYATGASTRMMIDYTGNIGINQTSPSKKLEIQTGTDTDGIIITGDGASMSTGQYRKIGFQYSNTDSSYASEIRFTVPVGGVHGGAIAFNTHQSGSATMTERGRFNQYGQLLINAQSSGYGSNNYGYNLGVRGNATQAFISIARNTQTLDTQGVIIGLDTAHSYFINRDATPMEFFTNNTIRMHIDGSENKVGIGGDAVSAAGVNNFLMIKGSAHSGIVFNDTDVAQTNEIWNDGGNLRFWDQIRGYKMQLYSNGNAEFFYDTTSRTLGIAQTSGTSGQGISLYGGAFSGEPTYGMMFMQTATFGTYGLVSGDWATYFTMNTTTTRGWIFRRAGHSNCASISAGGDLSLGGIISFPNTNMRLLGTSSSYLRIQSGSASDSGIELQNTSGTVLGYFYGNTSQMGMYNKEGYNLFKATPGASGVTTIYKGDGTTKIEAGDNVNIYHNTGTTTFNSNGYVQTQSWIYIGGGAGIYSATNGAHFYPNNSGSYATWKINGSRGGYTGIHMDYGNGVNIGMYDSGGNGGNWQASAGWHFYYHQGNGCLAVGSSTTSSSYSLYVTGSIYSTADVIAYSDKRAKENIVTVDSAIEKVNKLRGVYYTPKEGEDKSRKVGVIAQEILEVLPEVVTHDKENDRYGVDYGKMAGVFIEAIKELKAEVDSLKEQLKNK